jgi:CubicO group peptidase (beta-lactamase class C family)
MKDTVIARFNRTDFTGIYNLLDSGFQQQVSRDAVVNFLKGNQNAGKITRNSLAEEKGNKVTYLLSFELRDMLMDLELDENGRISGFGLKNTPPALLAKAPEIKTNNGRASALDLAVDSIVREYFRDPKANSLAIGLIRNGNKYIYTYGETDKSGGLLPDAETVYEIGSVTKTFTATLLARAVLEGKVKLTDDIRKYLDGNYPNLQFGDIPITLKDLANHTSRLPPMPPDIGEQPGYNPLYPEKHYSKSAFEAALAHVVLDTVPGYKFLYSNWGITVLGHILEQVYDKPESALIKGYITGRLNMKHTVYADEVVGTNIAVPHAENGRTLGLTDQGYFYPAGGLCTTVQDMLYYLNAQLKETSPAIKLTHQPTVNSMGLGWGVRTINGIRDIQHSGSEQGSNANITAYPELHNGCVILANSKANISGLVVRIQQLLKRR